MTRIPWLTTRNPRLIAAVSAVAAVALSGVLVVTLTGNAPPARPVAAPAHHVAPPPRPKPKPHRPARLFSPFTGEPVRTLGRVLAVKIDNIVTARPQTGLQSADLMYVIPVEGGLTRFMAVYSSRLPKVIGPVRSTREEDLNILRQFGKPALAYSGAAPHLLPFIHRSRLYDLYAGIAGGYYRVGFRAAPENLYANPRTLLREAPHASKARDIGFRFGGRKPAAP